MSRYPTNVAQQHVADDAPKAARVMNNIAGPHSEYSVLRVNSRYMANSLLMLIYLAAPGLFA